MYQLINVDNEVSVGYAKEIRYIKISPKNGCYVQAKPEEATGVAYMSNPYNLEDTEGLGAEATVKIISVDEGIMLNKLDSILEAIDEIEDALCELDKEAEVNE